MEYAQLNADGTFGWQINTHGNVEWDATHFCPASKLTPEEAEHFRVVPFELTPQPAFDPITQICFQSGGECVDGHWRSTWTTVDLPPDQVEERRKAAVPKEVSIREACQALEQAGLLDDIEAAIAAAPRSVQIDWARATTVRRDWPTLLQVQQLMGLTDQQIDDLFTLAATL